MQLHSIFFFIVRGERVYFFCVFIKPKKKKERKIELELPFFMFYFFIKNCVFTVFPLFYSYPFLIHHLPKRVVKLMFCAHFFVIFYCFFFEEMVFNYENIFFYCFVVSIVRYILFASPSSGKLSTISIMFSFSINCNNSSKFVSYIK